MLLVSIQLDRMKKNTIVLHCFICWLHYQVTALIKSNGSIVKENKRNLSRNAKKKVKNSTYEVFMQIKLKRKRMKKNCKNKSPPYSKGEPVLYLR